MDERLADMKRQLDERVAARRKEVAAANVILSPEDVTPEIIVALRAPAQVETRRPRD